MRWIIMTAALGLIAWSSPGVHARIESLFEDSVDPRAEAAIELRCGSEQEAFRDECARELTRDFELGVREPEAILRLHCTRFASDWTSEPSAASSICEKIYGGWIES
jgi:hypothetical protein